MSVVHQELCLKDYTDISFILSSQMGIIPILQIKELRLRDEDTAVEYWETVFFGSLTFLFIFQAEMQTAFVLIFVRMLAW